MVETNTLTLEATIASGESLSDAIDMSAFATNKDNYRLFDLSMPEEWTTANLTFQTSYDGVTYKNFQDGQGTEITIVAIANVNITLDPAIFAAVPYIKVRSGTRATPVNQAAARDILLVLRSV